MMTASLDATFSALSDPTRRAILARLAEDDPARLDDAVAALEQFKTQHGDGWQIGAAGKLLAEGEATVNELVAPFKLSQPAISKHLKVLEKAGLISRGRDAQKRPCRIEARPLAEASEWLQEYRKLWEANFERLDTLLDELKARKNEP